MLHTSNDTGLVVRELRGLTADEAAARLKEHGPNELPSTKERTILREIVDVVRQPMLLLLLGAGTVNLLLAEVLDGLLLLSFVLVVIGISIYQEHKTEHGRGDDRPQGARPGCALGAHG